MQQAGAATRGQDKGSRGFPWLSALSAPAGIFAGNGSERKNA